MGARKNGRVRGRHARGEGAPLACLLLARAFFLAPIYFLAPARQAKYSLREHLTFRDANAGFPAK